MFQNQTELSNLCPFDGQNSNNSC